jgi:2-polyprenyl-6-hydroxyphenyl methylase / 3-demethylubiquinone-9 3-methyltransferase
MKKPARTTIDAAEQAHFSAHADDWWEPKGSYRALHGYTAARLRFITAATGDLSGKSVLDIGCGAGLLCEPLARAGALVTGLDATAASLAAAKAHQGSLKIRYILGEAADLREQFDVVVASEVLEHVADAQAFLADASARLKPGGVLVLSTLNRTLPSLLLGVIAAEHILGLAPKGTHHWQKFRTPAEVIRALEAVGLEVGGMSGARYNPFTARFSLHPSATSINYLLWAQKPVKAKSAKQSRGRGQGKATARARQ